jgi:hypothetical protein
MELNRHATPYPPKRVGPGSGLARPGTIDACVNNALFGRPRFAVISRREEGAMRAIVTDEQRRNRPKVGLPEGPGRFRSGDCVVRRSHSPR